MINTFNTRLMALVLAAATLVGSVPVAAQNLDDAVSVSVRHGYINKPGAEILLPRIDKAAAAGTLPYHLCPRVPCYCMCRPA